MINEVINPVLKKEAAESQGPMRYAAFMFWLCGSGARIPSIRAQNECYWMVATAVHRQHAIPSRSKPAVMPWRKP